MQEDTILLKTKRGELRFIPPEGWRPLRVSRVEQGDDSPAHSIADEARKALEHPIEAPHLSRLVSKGSTVAILVDDLTRPTPKKEILPLILETLEESGVLRDDITIIVAIGTHRPLSQEELFKAIGREVMTHYRVMNHDSHARDLVPVGKLRSGAEVRINRSAFEADIRIGVGSIIPHPMNGFGGGGKILMPGISNFEAIKAHHLQHTFMPGTGLGRLEGNSFYHEIVDSAKAGRLDYIVNIVYSSREEPAGVVAGHFLHAHRRGSEAVRKYCSFTTDHKADITIITSFPYDEGPQVMKALAPASMVTKEGGIIIMIADFKTMLPKPILEVFERYTKQYQGKELEKVVKESFRQGKLLIEGGAMDLNMALGSALTSVTRFQLYLVSDQVSSDQVNKMGFRHALTLEEAVNEVAFLRPEADVHVIPVGGSAVPIVT